MGEKELSVCPPAELSVGNVEAAGESYSQGKLSGRRGQATLEQEASGQEREAGPKSWVPSEPGGCRAYHRALRACPRPSRACRRAGDSSAGMPPSRPARLHLCGGARAGWKQPTKHPVLTKCGKSRGRNKDSGRVGSRAGRQAAWLLSGPKLQGLSYVFVTLIYLGYMHVSGKSNPPFLFS